MIYTLTRDLTKAECPWMADLEIMRKGDHVVRYAGATYGAIKSGLAIVNALGQFVEIPTDAVEPAERQDDKGQADFLKCGAGRGADCCAYLLVSGDGVECGRSQHNIAGAIQVRVAMHEFTARRLPSEPFPKCQTDG